MLMDILSRKAQVPFSKTCAMHKGPTFQSLEAGAPGSATLLSARHAANPADPRRPAHPDNPVLVFQQSGSMHRRGSNTYVAIFPRCSGAPLAPQA
jgi:hypothetical protein